MIEFWYYILLPPVSLTSNCSTANNRSGYSRGTFSSYYVVLLDWIVVRMDAAPIFRNLQSISVPKQVYATYTEVILVVHGRESYRSSTLVDLRDFFGVLEVTASASTVAVTFSSPRTMICISSSAMIVTQAGSF
jgi:hypothetical protein